MAIDTRPMLGTDVLTDLVSCLIERSGAIQRTIGLRAGLSKDQLSRSLRGHRPLTTSEAVAILEAAGLPARGAITLAIYGRLDLAGQWPESRLGMFYDTLLAALPAALELAVADTSDRIDPRWGPQAARFLAQRIACHIRDMIAHEERLGDYEP